jgi:hypothetical protein
MGVAEATVTAVAGVALGAVGMVIGQVSLPDSAPSWMTTGGVMVCVTFTVWYAWYTTTKTIPNLVQDFRDEQKESRATHEKIVERISTAFEKAVTK